jgi:hypothetical protein
MVLAQELLVTAIILANVPILLVQMGVLSLVLPVTVVKVQKLVRIIYGVHVFPQEKTVVFLTVR